MGVLRDLVAALRRTRKRLRDGDSSVLDDERDAPEAAASPEPVVERPSRREARPPNAAAGYTVTFDPAEVRRLRRLETRTMRVVGVGVYLTDAERDEWKTQPVVLVPEPSNPVDPNAVTVARRDGRKVGYISAGTAKAYQPLLLEIGPLEVRCRAEGRKLWVTVPRLPALRKASG